MTKKMTMTTELRINRGIRNPKAQAELRKAWGFKDPWIGVDLDGTLAKSVGWSGYGYIGDPVPRMVRRIKRWIADGKVVKIFSSRAEGGSEAIQPIKQWCIENGLGELEVTNIKDSGMVELWDDLAVRVQENTGKTCCDYKGNWKVRAIYERKKSRRR